MSDTIARGSATAAQRLADALLRSAGGACAQLRIAAQNAGGDLSELGLAATASSEAVVAPVLMRKLRPTWRVGDSPVWELLVSASSVQQQVHALDLASAQALFAMTMDVRVGEQKYLIWSVASNEAFGEVYLYRVMLDEQ